MIKMTHRFVALLSAQGTACAETVLRDDDDTPRMRALIEGHIDPDSADPPIAGTWTDVTDNEACTAQYESPREIGA